MTSAIRKVSVAKWVTDASAGTKLGIWVIAIGLVCSLVQVVTLLCGNEISILGSGHGRTILVVVSLVSLLLLMANDQRSLAEFGLTIPSDWNKQSFRGALYGFAAYGSIFILALLTGAMEFNIDQSIWRQFRKTVEALVTAWPLAATEQVIFSAYMLHLTRAAVGRIGGILLCAAAFTGIIALGKSSPDITNLQWMLFIANLAMASILFSVIRLKTGSIVLPTGILAGVLMTSRIFLGSGLLKPIWGSDALSLLVPHNNPQMSPVLGCVLFVSTIAVTLRLIQKGEAEPISGSAISADFKKFLPFSNLSALAPIDLWIRQLNKAGWKINSVYFCRLAWILSVSTLNSILTLPERLLANRLLRHEVADPLLIVGVQRSGTTHLHNLLSQDPQFAVPKNLHILNPWGMLVTGWLVTPLLGLFMTMRRPMDAVKVNLFSPQEEEFAIASMTTSSPYWGFYFPREIAEHDRHIYPDKMEVSERNNWKRSMLLFLRKLTFWNRQTPLLKSPYNTSRVALFRELFPNVKTIHICREPYKTYLSNVHLANEGLVSFQLQDQPADGYSARFLDHYRQMEETFAHDVKNAAPRSVAYVRYEDLVKDPLSEVRRLYEEMGLTYTMKFHQRLVSYLASLNGYRPNRHPELPKETQEKIDASMGKYRDAWGYSASDDEISQAA